MRSPTLAILLLLSCLLAVPARADDWPQWRGPNRDGAWRETGILESFPPGGLKVRWKRNLERDYGVEQFCFNASPLIEGGLLIACIGSYGGSTPSWVLALDKDSGNEVWKAPNGGLTNSSPVAVTAEGKRQLIVWTQKSAMSLAPATGKTYWQEPMKTLAQNAVATPVFHKDLLLVGGLMLKFGADKPGASNLWPEAKAERKGEIRVQIARRDVKHPVLPPRLSRSGLPRSMSRHPMAVLLVSLT